MDAMAAMPKTKASLGADLARPAKVCHIERSCVALDTVRQAEEHGDGHTVGEHQEHGRGPGQ